MCCILADFSKGCIHIATRVFPKGADMVTVCVCCKNIPILGELMPFIFRQLATQGAVLTETQLQVRFYNRVNVTNS